jgi:hypothetical protein
MAKKKRNDRAPGNQSVCIPSNQVTYLPNNLITEMLPQLVNGPNLSHVFLNFYSRAWHNPEKTVRASWIQLAKWTNLDYRAVQACVRELEKLGFVTRIMSGTAHSRIDLPTWGVSAASELDLRRGNWFAVPTFIIRRYMRAHRACAVLVPLLYFQNLQKLNASWPSARTLAELLGWAKGRAYEALHLLGTEEKWEQLGTGLPRPLQILWNPFNKNPIVRRNPETGRLEVAPDKLIRYYSVLAVQYLPLEEDRKHNSRPVLHLRPEFASISESRRRNRGNS